MRIVSIAMQKGGSGKSTTTVNLAATLANAGKDVLVIDLDAHQTTTKWLVENYSGKGIFACFESKERVESIVINTPIERVKLAPSSEHLDNVARAISGEVAPQLILKESLVGLSGYDFVLMDCPPDLGVVTTNALCAASEYLVPVECRAPSLDGVVKLQKIVQIIQKHFNPSLSLLGVLACRLDFRNRHSQAVFNALKESFGPNVFNTPIRENVKLSEAYSFGQPISAYDPTSNGAQDYRALAKEVIQRGVK